jgi:hypothetical protein
MVLTTDAVAVYRNSSLKRECSKLLLDDIVCIGAMDSLATGRHCLELRTSWRRFIVATDTAAERDSWLQALGAPAPCGLAASVPAVTKDKLLLEEEVLEDLREILSPLAASRSTGSASRMRAASVLLQMRPALLRQCLPLLCELAASDGDAEVRRLAVVGLATLPAEDADDVWSILLNSLSDTDPDVRFHAAEGLGHFCLSGCPTNIRGMLRSALIRGCNGDRNDRVRQACTSALMKLNKLTADSLEPSEEDGGEAILLACAALPQPGPCLPNLERLCAAPCSDMAGKSALTPRSTASTLAAPESVCISFGASECATNPMPASTESEDLTENDSSLRRTKSARSECKSLRSDCTLNMPDVHSIPSFVVIAPPKTVADSTVAARRLWWPRLQA